ncbi:MAG: zinc-ribbon domain-containing protein [Ardenticatenaceae bacterium]|nr:zinc-ribbon domain-containing protein [Ardenticatenaceae bacterium]
MSDTFICPHCGADVPLDAVVCPECGSDDETGWSEETAYDGLGLYDDEPVPQGYSPQVKWVVTAVILLTLSAFIAATFRWGIYLIPLVLLGVAYAYYHANIRPHTASHREKQLYDDLLLKARGDRALVERWIGYEWQRTPHANRLELLEDALQRWYRDNR